jgi:hypothetical protein
MLRQRTEDEVNRIVRQIDGTRRDLFSMDDVEAPDGRAFPKRQRQDPRIVRAKTRLRTAAWRKRNAEDRRATADQVARAVLKALVTSSEVDLAPSDRSLVGRVLVDLSARGFDLKHAVASLKRMRVDMLGHVGNGGAGRSSGPHGASSTV